MASSAFLLKLHYGEGAVKIIQLRHIEGLKMTCKADFNLLVRKFKDIYFPISLLNGEITGLEQ